VAPAGFAVGLLAIPGLPMPCVVVTTDTTGTCAYLMDDEVVVSVLSLGRAGRPAPLARPRTPVIYRPESAVFWMFVVALLVGIVALLQDSAVTVHETMDGQLALGPIWLAFIVFLVWLMFKFDPFRSVRRWCSPHPCSPGSRTRCYSACSSDSAST
jgi:hypothetical protein